MSGPNIVFKDNNAKDKSNILSLPNLVIVGVLAVAIVIYMFKAETLNSESRVLVIQTSNENKNALEVGLCETAIDSFKNGECKWGVMDEDTCYSLETEDELVNNPARFKVLYTKYIGNKCKVFARDQKEDEGKVLRAFAVTLDKNENKYPWIYQVVNIQEVFVTEKEKKRFDI